MTEQFTTIEYLKDYGDMFIAVNKVGGGTLGKAYDGSWEVTVFTTISTTYPFEAGTPKTHEEVADTVREIVTSEGFNS